VAGFTFLNPHVYLDTVILLGALANQAGEGRWLFASGAVIASLVWFFGLGYGARLVAPVFARPKAWQILDGFIALVMLSIALTLLLTKP
jgi:L-lysine exporter family protein LysE/ArgO